MKKLHWHTDKNPCLLCGHPVTPEGWEGGLVDLGKGFAVIDCYTQGGSCKVGTSNQILCFKAVVQVAAPIHPPKGWKSLTEEQINIELGEGNAKDWQENTTGAHYLVGRIRVYPSRGIEQFHRLMSVAEFTQNLTDAQNALALYERLKAA